MKIGGHDLDKAVMVIAEIGVNHNGDRTMARRLVNAAKDCGADAVKVQWFKTDALIARRGPKAAALRPYELSGDVLSTLSEYTHALGLKGRGGIMFLASVFDTPSAAEYLALNPPAVKIGSGELTCWDLIQQVGRHPVILSTGMATMGEIHAARLRCQSDVALLHCVSAYPTALADVNLRALDTLRDAFGVPVGFSDHTMGHHAAFAAVARGARIIEKHLTLNQSFEGPDHAMSATPPEFSAMVHAIRTAEIMLGDGRKIPRACEHATLKAIGR